MRAAHAMRFGAELLAGGGVRFALWAPSQPQVTLQHVVDGTHCLERRPMRRHVDGWHECIWPDAAAGMRYRFELGQGRVLPDPASRFNPQGVHGPSEVTDPHAYDWADGGWTGLPWHQVTLYELHVGCFTPEGSLQPHLPAQREGGRWLCDDFGFRVEWPLGKQLCWTMRARFGGAGEAWPLVPGETQVYRTHRVGSAEAAAAPADQLLVTLQQRAAA